jgi:hypothetical protein
VPQVKDACCTVPAGNTTQVALVSLHIRFDLGIRRAQNRLDQIQRTIGVLLGGLSLWCLRDQAFRDCQTTFRDILPVNLYYAKRNPLMRLLNFIDATMADCGLVEASSGFVCIFRLKHENVQSFKAGERGGDFRDRAFNALDNARKSGGRHLKRDGVSIVRKVALLGDNRHDLNEIACEGSMHIGSPKGSGWLTCVA